MRSRIISLLLVFVFTGLLVGHKAAAAVYDDTSKTIRPSANSYGSSDEFVRDSIIYLYPRACVYYTTGDTIRSGENEKPGKFHLNSIIENAEKDGWYVASVQPVLAAYGALSFYFNKDTGKFSCTGKGINFENSRWLDLESLSSRPKQPTPEAVAEKTAEAYEKAKLLLGNNCIKGFKRHLDRTPKKVVTVFAYARKGTTGPYTCRGAWGLAIEKTKTLAIAVCEKARAKYEGLSDTPCEVFAIGNKILWKGHVTVGGSQKGGITKAIMSLTDYRICNLALKTDLSDWAPRKGKIGDYVKDVEERRGFTPEKCVAILGVKTTPSSTLSRTYRAPQKKKSTKR